MAAEPYLLVTCEHGGNRVPAAYRRFFRGRDRLLASHRGWDPGALEAARIIAGRLGARLLTCETTRLLVDLNRPLGHPDLFSEVMATAPATERAEILGHCYHPYHASVRAAIEAGLARHGRVLHVGVHSFTPVRRGVRRAVEIGLLYDPGRQRERSLCRAWQAGLIARLPRRFRVRRNQPYRGAAAGLTTICRRRYGPAYLGIEIEINQRLMRRPARQRAELAELLAETLRGTPGS